MTGISYHTAPLKYKITSSRLTVRLRPIKKEMGLIIPLIVACFALLLGWIPLIGAGILVAVYFITRYNEKLKAEKKNEIDRMNKMDL